jgi:hypothetical protein
MAQNYLLAFRHSRIFSCETVQHCSPCLTVTGSLTLYQESLDHGRVAFSAASKRLEASSVVLRICPSVPRIWT